MSRKPHLVPATLSREEALERRIADLERAVRSIPVRQQQAAASGNRQTISQASHGLAVGNVVRYNGSAWVKSQADTGANAIAGGIVSRVLSADVFDLSTSGYVTGLSGLTPGAVHYLSATTAGLIATTWTTIALPILLADSASSGVIVSMNRSAAAGLTLLNASLFSVFSRSTPGTSSGTIPGPGLVYVSAFAGGGGGGRGTGASVGFIAPSSGATATTQVFRGVAGGSGAGGGRGVIVLGVQGGESYSLTVGAGGAKGVGVGANGSDGADTVVVVGGVTCTAYGGGGGRGGSNGGSGGTARGISAPAIYTALEGLYLQDAFSTPGANGADRIDVSGQTVTGGLLPTGTPATSGRGGRGEDYVLNTGGSSNHADGVDGFASITWMP